jgi:hypothetical protein
MRIPIRTRLDHRSGTGRDEQKRPVAVRPSGAVAPAIGDGTLTEGQRQDLRRSGRRVGPRRKIGRRDRLLISRLLTKGHRAGHPLEELLGFPTDRLVQAFDLS